MTPRRILLVEDDPDQRTSLAEWLRQRGYLVVEASSAEEAIDHLGAGRFDLLITDYRLGGATGTWLARIAAQTEPVGTPALLVTAHRQVSDAEGMEVVRKPLLAEDFLAKVEQALLATPPGPRPLPPPRQRAALVLYVSRSIASRRASTNLKAILDRYDASQVALTTIDVGERAPNDHEPELDKILVTPTLLRTFPPPRVWVAGDLHQPELVERLLDQAGVDRRE